MKIDGKAIASEIFSDLTKRVDELKKKNIIPHLVVVLVGNDPASEAYVRQKDIKTQMIGGIFTIKHLPVETSEEKLLATIEQYNNDNNVHGLIIQRPLPKHISSEKINQSTNPIKDIDAFLPHSPFTMPLAAAVLKILEHVFSQCHPELVSGSRDSDLHQNDNLISWLRSKRIVVMGKGETGGGPTITLLHKLGATSTVIDSKTVNAPLITEEADIIISTVGRANIVRPENIKKGVILIGVGMHRGEDGKLHGDYEEEDIKDIASFYTPIPGGVGPVNVAMLLVNLLQATEK